MRVVSQINSVNPIDPKIMSAVIALRAWHFATTASCQGHLSRGEPAPWIDIGVTPRPKTPAGEKQLRRTNLHEQRRLLRLLDAFYRQHITETAVRLILTPFGFGFQITNQGAEIQRIVSPKRRRRVLQDFQREFQAFADFLKSKASAL